MSFRWVPKSGILNILNGVMAVILRYFIECGSFRGPLRKAVEEGTPIVSIAILILNHFVTGDFGFRSNFW